MIRNSCILVNAHEMHNSVIIHEDMSRDSKKIRRRTWTYGKPSAARLEHHKNCRCTYQIKV